ncbi:MAG: DUF58 domain-containing protein [Myxococcota bacterium]|nr:DUF58 domain-containing protein [Myxococcota bacterium]
MHEVSHLQRILGLRPRTEFLILLVIGFVTSLAGLTMALNFIPWLIGWHVLIISIGLLDVAFLLRGHKFHFSRQVPEVLSCGDEFEIQYSLRSSKPIEVFIRDEHPLEISSLSSEKNFEWRRITHEVQRWSERFSANKRGNCRWTKSNLIIRSPLRMWAQRLQPQLPVSVLKIFPRLSSSDSNLYDPTLLLAEFGIRPKGRRRGVGQEFRRLRPLSPGDSIRRIDWRATARSQRHMVREYQPDERSEVLLCLDFGRLMGVRNSDDRTKLDEAIDAVARFALVAIASGDKVGILTFGDRVRDFVPPADGTMQFRLLLESIYDLKASQNESNFTATFSKISQANFKHSLIVFFTDFVDQRSADDLLRSLNLLVKKHRILFVSISDPASEDVIYEPVQSTEQLSLSLAALHLSLERDRLTHKISRLGIEALDLGPDELTSGAINAYLQLRHRGDI